MLCARTNCGSSAECSPCSFFGPPEAQNCSFTSIVAIALACTAREEEIQPRGESAHEGGGIRDYGWAIVAGPRCIPKLVYLVVA